MNKNADVELSSVVTGDNLYAKGRSVSVDNSHIPLRTILRHTQSHSSLRRPIPPIPEDDDDDQQLKRYNGSMQTLNVPDLNGVKRKMSTTSMSTVRGSSTRSNPNSGSGIDNKGFKENNSADATSFKSQYSSNQSLSTYKEQYCCTPNCTFTPRERKLCVSVAVLATIVVILVIVVGILAGPDQKGGEHTFRWTF